MSLANVDVEALLSEIATLQQRLEGQAESLRNARSSERYWSESASDALRKLDRQYEIAAGLTQLRNELADALESWLRADTPELIDVAVDAARAALRKAGGLS